MNNIEKVEMPNLEVPKGYPDKKEFDLFIKTVRKFY